MLTEIFFLYQHHHAIHVRALFSAYRSLPKGFHVKKVYTVYMPLAQAGHVHSILFSNKAFEL